MQNNKIIKPDKYVAELEKIILLALVENYKYVLACKKSDARTIALKQHIWQGLVQEYNCQPRYQTAEEVLREHQDSHQKQLMAHERREKVTECQPTSE